MTGIGLYSGHIEHAELSCRLNVLKFDTLLSSHNINVSHIDMELPCNVELRHFLQGMSTVRPLTHLRLTARRDPTTRNDEALFRDLTEENYRTQLTPALPQVQHLTLARFRICKDERLLSHYLPHLTPGLVELHFEDCRISRQCGFYQRVFTQTFTNLQYVWCNGQILFEVERVKENDSDEVAKEKNAKMRRLIPMLYKKRGSFWVIHELAVQQVRNEYRLNGLNRVSCLLHLPLLHHLLFFFLFLTNPK